MKIKLKKNEIVLEQDTGKLNTYNTSTRIDNNNK